ncbi:unnamed protein product [Cuscuta campestris]|uniref:Transposase (putative) gypsy type domain-containing protein n=1 Tax=Cuscuta campestris TaxID=132261 RepID=A0A484NA50_9ASTE|nr:unnamed protein product [Cuscuta campestris]
MQKAQVHELRNLMPDGYQLSYRATWKNIISLHAGTTIGIHYHSIKDLGEFSIHPFKVLFFETCGIMPGQLAPNGHRMLSSFINVCCFLRIPLSLRLFDHMFDVRPGFKETLGFVIVSSHQGRTFLSNLPLSNRGWKDKYVSIKFPPGAFPFAQNAWGKRMKVQVKPRETDDLEATLRTGDTSTRGPYNVGKWGVYPGLETDPEPEIILGEAIPDAIPLRRMQGSKALEFCRRPPQSYQEAYNTAWDYADAEAQVSSKRETEQGHSKGRISLKKEIELPGRVKAEVMEVKPAKEEKKPAREKQWTEKYCSFHKTDSHNTADCNSVKGVIKQMIEAGELDPEYLAHAKQKKNQWIRPKGQPAEQNKKKKAPSKEHLHVIYGGPEGGDFASQRKKWGRELYIGIVAQDPQRKQTRREPITFTDRDLPATGEDHNDPLVITMDMGGVDVSRVLVDTGSSVNVLYLEAFQKLKLCWTRLEHLKTPLSGFTGGSC